MSVDIGGFDAVGPRHAVQLYGNDPHHLADSAARFLSEGLHVGDGLVLVATAAHCHAITSELRGHTGYQSAVQQAQLVVFDADIVVSRCMNNGYVEWRRFEEIIGGALRRASSRSASGMVRAFDEMSGLLWRAEQANAALLVEEYWNRLTGRHRLSLICAYPIDMPADEPRPSTALGLLCAHTHFVPARPEVERALRRALRDVLGGGAADLRASIRNTVMRPWADAPTAEAMMLWLEANRPEDARRVLDQARHHHRAA